MNYGGVITIIATLLGAIVAYFFAENKRKDTIIKQKEGQIERKQKIIEHQKNNLDILKDHNNAVDEIKKNKINIDKKIKEANNDEKVNDIINDIIRLNNERLRYK